MYGSTKPRSSATACVIWKPPPPWVPNPILVRTGKGEKTLAAGGLPELTHVCYDLMDAALYLISKEDADRS